MHKELITKGAVKQVLRDYWEQYKASPWEAIIAFSFPAVGTILVYFVPPLIIGRLLNLFATKGAITFSDTGLYIALFGGLWLAGEILWRIAFHALIRLEGNGINNLSKLAFKRLTDRDYDFYTNHFIGSLTKKAIAFGRNYETFTDTLVFNITANVFPIVFVVVILWRYSPWIPTILVSCLLVVIAISLPIIRRRAKYVVARHDASSQMVGRLTDTVGNIFAVKSFAKEKEEYKVYGEYVNDFTNKFKKAADFNNINLNTILSPIYVTTNLIGLASAIFFAQKLGLQAGAVVVVFSYYSQVTRIFWDVNRVYRDIESSISESAEFVQMFMDVPAVLDAPGAQALSVQEGRVQFIDAEFAYPEKEEGVSFMNNFNLDIPSRQKVGLVGPSGGGKTTITKLLLRFIDLQGGTVAIDRQDIKQVTQASLREAISYVPQEPLLFHRSLFENIAYGQDNATEEQVINAAKLAHAHEFISELPEGYKTMVGERGVKLSGGQRQRVAIARAILKNSPILILDEATSSLDSESEKYIQEGLWELMKDKTALVIAHRLSTIKHLDRIIVLDDGAVVEDGTHEELIAQKGLYAKLWSHQSGEFLE